MHKLENDLGNSVCYFCDQEIYHVLCIVEFIISRTAWVLVTLTTKFHKLTRAVTHHKSKGTAIWQRVVTLIDRNLPFHKYKNRKSVSCLLPVKFLEHITS